MRFRRNRSIGLLLPDGVARRGLCEIGAGSPLFFAPSGATAYQYYRIYVTANNGNASYVSLQEWDLYEGATDRSSGRTAPSDSDASSTDSGSPRGNAFDGDYTSGTVCWVNNGDGVPAWLSVNLTAPYALTSYAVTCQNHSVGPNRAPKDFVFQGSATGLTGPWTDIDTQTNQTAWAQGETRTFTL